ncbi:MAG: hypothetical protein M1821_003106 [Bathelium mastoideum]|nr:MAG: hypothetical protein M1821_003106 [Bathelium mastoideum]
MFSRRRAASNPPPNNKNPTPSAALAASQAFLKDRNSNASLSSAAAATALRSLTTSPEPVGNIQTKRMQRRGSQSSNGSAAAKPRAVLQRQNSSGSMTERTFRSPSPNRPQSSHSAPDTTVPAAYDAPPVPALPANISRPLSKQANRTSIADSAPSTQTAQSQTVAPRGRVGNIDGGRNEPSPESNQRASVNFSRPLSPSPRNTPPASPVPTQRPQSTGGWQTGPKVGDTSSAAGAQPTRTVPTPAGKGQIQQKIQSAADQPIKKKKKKQAGPSPQGTHLAAGGMHVGPAGTAVQNSATSKVPQNAGKVVGADGQVPKSQNPSTVRPKNKKQGPTAATLVKQPSIVREDREAEEQASQTPQRPQTSLKPAPNARQIEGAKPATSGNLTANALASTNQSLNNIEVGSAGPSQPNNRNTVQEKSQSPARSARFSSAPLAVEKDGIRHSPPLRSISPAKSALKHSPGSVRGSSPATSQVGGRAPGSDFSDTASQISEDGRAATKKKKNVRVSFDEVPAVVATDPLLGSLRERAKPSRPNRLDFNEDDTSDVLKPRPVLPSFGSVRGRKTPTEEEPLEKVTETVPSSMTTSASTLTIPQSVSGDLAAAEGISIQDQESKNEKVPQSDKPTPLPPEVTSREGLTYGSDSDTDEDVPVPTEVPNSESPHREFHNITNGAETLQKGIPELQEPEKDSDLAPEELTINVQPPTPAAIDRDETSSPVPGAFPEDPIEYTETDNETEVDATSGNESYYKGSPGELPKESSTPAPNPDGPTDASKRTEPPIAQSESEYESDEESIYSDAAEDPSELEGGFASLDAILESPVQAHAEPSMLSTPTDSPSTRLAKKYNPLAKSPTGPVENPTSLEPATPSNPQDWDKAKSYWSSLSEQKKKEAEQEARPTIEPQIVQASQEAAVPTVAEPKPKPKKKAKSAAQSSAPSAVAVPKTVAPKAAAPKAAAPKSTGPRQRPQLTGSDSIPPMRQTMRSTMRPSSPESSQPATHLRQSMRSEGMMRTSMRDGPLPQKQAPSTQPREPRGALQKKNIRSTPTPPSTGVLGTGQSARAIAAETLRGQIQRPSTAANDSDSESSFRKKKKRDSSSTNDGGRYTMKRSMRDSAAEPSSPTSPAGNRSARFSIRSLSPKPAAPSAAGMRSSMRTGSLDMNRPLRESKSPSRFSITSFGRSKVERVPDPPSTRGRGKAPAGSRFRSRFADSSDEEDDDKPRAGGRFRSRFADSDDESDVPSPTLPAGLAPVRGIPKRHDDGSSTDLSDEEEQRRTEPPPAVPSSKDVEQALNTRPKATNAAPATNGNTGKALASGTLRDGNTAAAPSAPPKRAESRTRRFFTLGKKKPDPSSLLAPHKEETEGEGGEPSSTKPTHIPSPSELPPLGTTTALAANPARPSSPSAAAGTVSPPRSPKLQRRNPHRQVSDSWPLPPPIPATAAAAGGSKATRPSTSDGTPGGAKRMSLFRPALGERAQTEREAGGAGGGDGEGGGQSAEGGVAYGRRGKPKKFQALRRAFGLRD